MMNYKSLVFDLLNKNTRLNGGNVDTRNYWTRNVIIEQLRKPTPIEDVAINMSYEPLFFKMITGVAHSTGKIVWFENCYWPLIQESDIPKEDKDIIFNTFRVRGVLPT